MAPTPPQLDEHGFPIPPTFDDDGRRSRRRGGSNRGILWLLFLVFIVLVVGGIAKSGGWQDAKQWFAELLLNRARQKVLESDLPGALADLERAAALSPDNPNVYDLRAQIRFEQKDLQGALADYDKLIKLNGRYARAYQGRSQVYQRLNRHREAIDDLTQVIKLSSERDAESRNNRAYARAIGGIELEEGFEDIQQSLEFSAELRGKPNTPENANAAFLDTRGYLHLLLGRPQEALADLDQAIKNAAADQRAAAERMGIAQQPSQIRARFARLCAQELAVIYHHRGQAHEALGHAAEAEDDLRKGQELGYNPKEGVY